MRGGVDQCTPIRWRLVFYYKQPKFQELEAAAPSEYNEPIVENVCKPSRDKIINCSRCVCPFALKWTNRLLDHRLPIRCRAYRSLSNIVPAVRCCSVKVEKTLCWTRDQAHAPEREISDSNEFGKEDLSNNSHSGSCTIADYNQAASYWECDSAAGIFS